MAIRQTADGFEVRLEVRRRFVSREEARVWEKQARESLSRVHTGIVLSSASTILEGIEPYVKSRKVKRGIGKNRARDIQTALRRWAGLLFGAGDGPLDAVTVTILEEAIAKRLEMPGYRGGTVSRGTVRKELGILRAFGGWAVERGIAPPLPWLSVEIDAPRPAHRGGRLDWMPLSEWVGCVRRIDATHPQVALPLYAVALLGLRPEAVCALRRRDVTLPCGEEPGVIRPRALKGGAYQTIPVPEESARHALILRALALWKEFRGASPARSAALFPTRRGGGAGGGWSSSSLAREVRRVADALGLPGEFRAYVARHSTMTFLQDARGVGVGTVQRFAGHRRIETQNVYAHGRGAETAYEAVDIALGAALGSGRVEV